MLDRRQHAVPEGGAWGQPGGAPATVDGVRCGSCGAHTPVLGTEPRCLYCGLLVELPSDVARRADEVQQNIYIARGEAEQLDRELMSEGAGYVNGILALQIVGILVSLAFWVDLLRRAEQGPTLLQLTVVAGAFLGPLLFSAISQHFRVGRELRKLAKLSFARLEVEVQPTGIEMHLSCSGCGGSVDASYIEGLTIRCKHCNNAMLAPARLVDAGQRNYMQKVLALRRRLSRNVLAKELTLVALGAAYVTLITIVLVNLKGVEVDHLTAWVLVTFFYPFCLTWFWVFTSLFDDSDRVWACVILSAIPLAPVMAHVIAYLEATGVMYTPPPIPH